MSRHKFGIQFSIAARLWRRHLDQRLAQAGIKDISWAPLLHLDEFGDGISQKELAASVGMEGSTLVRLLDTLEQKGQIERQSDTYDRRAKRIFLTATGREHVVSLRAELLAIETDMLADVSDEQIEVMRQVLGGLITKFKH